jgi:hypothetical protein
MSQTPDSITATHVTATGTVNAKTALVVAGVDVAGALITGPTTPASAAATGTAGTVVWDASFIYVCVAANTWKRVAIATW